MEEKRVQTIQKIQKKEAQIIQSCSPRVSADEIQKELEKEELLAERMLREMNFPGKSGLPFHARTVKDQFRTVEEPFSLEIRFSLPLTARETGNTRNIPSRASQSGRGEKYPGFLVL